MTFPEKFEYERGVHRVKHCWKHEYADFQEVRGALIGKCPSTITDEIAEEILNSGFAFRKHGCQEIEYIYAVYKGVVYEAAPTEGGKSFHGYPWRGDRGLAPLPDRILEGLEKAAIESDCLAEFKKWMKQFGGESC